MCDGRILAVDDHPDWPAARAAGWGESDLAWEFGMAQAAESAESGDERAAKESRLQCLALARKRFAPDDPRLGASLASVVFARMRCNGRADSSDPTDAPALAESRRIWAQSPGWIDRMRPEQMARSSVHHLRMEAKHRRAYQAVARRRLQDFAAEARAAVERLADGGEVTVGSPQQWRAERPPVFGDSRKILAACLLMGFRIRG